jgi:small conductance mechanosensitive channel
MKPVLTDMRQIILIVGILGLALILSYFANKALNRYALYSSKSLNVSPTNFRLLKTLSSFTILILALIIVFHLIPGLEKLGTTLLASAGILSVIIGLAAQQTFGNIISGIFIFIYKPFRVGDYVELNDGKNGIVEDINLRFTIIRSGENRRMVIPNTLISNQVIINSNVNQNPVCIFLPIPLAYDTDIDRAIVEVQRLVAAHPDYYGNRSTGHTDKESPAVAVRVESLDHFCVDLCAEVWCRTDAASYAMKCDLLLAIKKTFDKEGIKMAAQTMNVILTYTPPQSSSNLSPAPSDNPARRLP